MIVCLPFGKDEAKRSKRNKKKKRFKKTKLGHHFSNRRNCWFYLLYNKIDISVFPSYSSHYFMKKSVLNLCNIIEKKYCTIFLTCSLIIKVKLRLVLIQNLKEYFLRLDMFNDERRPICKCDSATWNVKWPFSLLPQSDYQYVYWRHNTYSPWGSVVFLFWNYLVMQLLHFPAHLLRLITYNDTYMNNECEVILMNRGRNSI